MWSLKSTKDENCCYYFLNDTQCAVGRKDAGILILKDPSVSRQHAILTVTHPEENLGDPSKFSVLKLKDKGSKYGTFKNNVRLGEAEAILHKGDVVKFGQFESEFRVCLTPLVVTTSCIDQFKKGALKKVVQKLGGHLVSEWRPSCTHLVMSDVKVTVKALCCMVSLKPLVSPEYFNDLMNSYRERTSIPKSNEYIPPSGEALLDKEKVSFDINSERKRIFKDKTFVFLDEKQYKKLHLPVTIGGGKAVILDEDKSLDSDFITRDGSCIIQPVGEITKKEKFLTYARKLSSALHKKKKRMIPESEFGLSVAYCSTERFCNPDFDIGSTLLGNSKLPSQTFSQQEVYAPDTESQTQNSSREKLSCTEETTFSKLAKSKDGPLNRIVEDSQENLFDKKRKSYPCTSEEISFGDQTGISNQVAKKIKIETVSSSATELRLKFQGDYEVRSIKSALLPMSVKQEPASAVSSVNTPETQKSLEMLTTEACVESSSFQSRPNIATDIKAEKSLSKKCDSSVKGILTEQINGFRSCTVNQNNTVPEINLETVSTENMPRNLLQVHIVELIKRKTKPPITLNNSDENEQHKTTKNFKKFRKVLHVGARALPKIIGGHELIAHNKHTSKAIGDWLQLHPESQDHAVSEECGEFDWDSQATKKRKR